MGDNGPSGSSSSGAANSAVLLVRHLPRDATEASVADAFRVYAPVSGAVLLFCVFLALMFDQQYSACTKYSPPFRLPFFSLLLALLTVKLSMFTLR